MARGRLAVAGAGEVAGGAATAAHVGRIEARAMEWRRSRSTTTSRWWRLPAGKGAGGGAEAAVVRERAGEHAVESQLRCEREARFDAGLRDGDRREVLERAVARRIGTGSDCLVDRAEEGTAEIVAAMNWRTRFLVTARAIDRVGQRPASTLGAFHVIDPTLRGITLVASNGTTPNHGPVVA